MHKFRQYRKTEEIRNRYAEVCVKSNDFIYPYFVVDGLNKKQEIKSLHDVFRFSSDTLLQDIDDLQKLGINNILLFGVIEDNLKDEIGSSAWNDDNLISKVIRKIKSYFPEITIFTDVCLCGYTSHGHCGILKKHSVDNDSTLPLLGKMALQHAIAGADFVAPSAMMDGQVEKIKEQLRKHNLDTKILSYSVKYSSSFYGPFRDAANSAPSFGDRKTYQMDYRNISQALAEVKADIDEGADWVMVKPAHTYLDIIQRIKHQYSSKTLAAYQVSGEYMMIKIAAQAGLLNEKMAMHEALTAIKRAGADKIITYYAKKFVEEGL